VTIEPARQSGGIVDSSLQTASQVDEIQSGIEVLLGVLEQKPFTEIGECGAPSETIIDGRDRPARNAGDERDLVEIGSAAVRADAVEALHHAVSEGGGARPAAGKGERHHRVAAHVRQTRGNDSGGIGDEG
jgi:hypothetical protein